MLDRGFFWHRGTFKFRVRLTIRSMERLLAPNELCSAILAIKLGDRKENMELNGPQLVKARPVRVFSETRSAAQLKQLTQELKSFKPFEDVLIRGNYSSPFVLPSFPKAYSKEKPNVRDIALVLNSYLTICVQKMYEDSDKVILLFKSFNILLYNPNLSQCYRQMIISAFVNLFNHTYRVQADENMPEFMRVVCEFFSRPLSIPPCTFEMLVSLARRIVNLNYHSFANLGSELMGFIDGLVLQIGDKFPKEHLQSILQLSCSSLSGLDTTSLIMFAHMTQYIDLPTITAFVPIIPLALIAHVERATDIPDVPQGGSVICLTDTAQFIEPQVFITDSIFGGPIDLTNPIKLTEHHKYDTLLPDELYKKTMMAAKVITSNEELIKFFLQMCPRFFTCLDTSKHAFGVMSVALIMFKQIAQTGRHYLPLGLLSHRVVFDPAVTIFDPPEQWEIVDTLRSLAIELIVHEGMNAVQTVLYGNMVYPLLFAELMHRFMNCQQISVEAADVTILSQTLMSTMIYYQKFRNLSEESRQASMKARLSIFYYLNILLSQNKLLAAFFNDEFFVESYISMLFEEPVRPIVLSSLTNYLVLDSACENVKVIDHIIESIKKASKLLSTKEAVVMLTDVIRVIEKAIVHVPRYAQVFSDVTVDVCKGLIHVPNIEESKQLVLEILTFMTSSAEHHSISSPEISSLETVIVELFHEPSPALFAKIIQLVAGQSLPSMHPSFTIRQPKVLRLLVGVFLGSAMLNDSIAFIARLCQASITNREEAHRGEFDSYLIDLLNIWRNDASFPIKTIASVISLFMMIANTVSSVAVVQKFMSLLCPIDGKYFPAYDKLIMKSLCSLTLSAPKKPVCAMPYVSQSGFDFENLRADAFNDGITLSFWLNLNDTHPSYRPQLLLISDSKGISRIGVFLNGNSVMAVMEIGERQVAARLDHNLEERTWSFLTVSFRAAKDHEHFYVSSFYNGEDTREIMFPYIPFQGSLCGRIGGVSTDSIAVDQPALMGPVGIFRNLKIDEVRHLYELGPCISSAKVLAPSCFFVPQEAHGIMTLVNNGFDKAVTINAAGFRYIHSIPFSDVLVSRCGIELILPLFAQWDLKFADGSDYDYFSGTTLDLLESTLLLSEDAQKVFAESSGFKIIAHLLMSSDCRHVSYNLYLKFVQIFENLSCQELRGQLFDSVLLNIELWMKCSAENHRRIVRHWSRVLVPASSDLLKEYRPFYMLMSALRGYYWYEPCEHQVILLKDRCRGEELNVKECRASILMIAHAVAKDSFTELDFQNILSYILTCRDYEQNVDMLRFLNELIQEQTGLFSKFESSNPLISLLQYLFNMKNNDIVCLTLKTIVNSHKSGLIKEITLEQHVDIMLHQICPEFVTKGLLAAMIDLTDAHAELFPICSWMALNIGEKGVRQMLSKLKPSKIYSTSEYWAVYCVAVLYNGSSKLRTYLSRFLITCATDSLLNLFATVEIVGRALGQASDPIKNVMLMEYGKMLQRKTPGLSFEAYLKLIRHFLMFRCDEGSNAALADAFAKSPYVFRRHIKMNIPDTETRRVPMSPKEGRRRARHSLRPNSILAGPEVSGDNRYSPLLAQRALAYLNPPKPAHQNKRDFRTRRTSLMTVARQRVDVDVVPNSPDSVTVSLMPSELDEKIAEIATKEFSYHFGLRLDRYQNWEDAELAEQALHLIQNENNAKYSETALVIASFLVHFKPEVVKSVIDSIKIPNSEQLRGAWAMLNHHLSLAKLPEMNSMKKEDVEIGSFEYVQKLQSLTNSAISTAPLRFMKHIMKFQSANSEKAFDIFTMISDDIVGMSSTILADYSDIISQSKGMQKKLWRQFWRCMTIDRAPWHQSIPVAVVQEVHFKRDMTICGNMCPVKLKQNYGFTDHMDAVFLRDIGSIKGAQVKFEQYKNELAKQYEANAPTELLEAVVDQSVAQSLKRRRSVELKPCIIELPCELITVTKVLPGVFSLFEDAVILSRDSGKVTRIRSEQIKDVFFRTRFHHPTAIEIFRNNGKSYFINFPDVNSLTVLNTFKKISLPRIRTLQLKDFRTHFNTMKLVNNWVSGKMSNFDYLMQLNRMSGRSFNDTSQYPILPWVLQDFTSTKLDLSNPKVYRDLSLPIGATTPDRLHELQEKANTLVNLGMPRYLYSSGVINPLNVYLYLLRMEPFTTLHIEIQSGRFDHAARLFSSIEHSWHLVSTMQNDYRELIPEFFCSPEFLVNRDGFDFGVYDHEKVNHVKLPAWASTPLEFIYLHRKALESEYVTKNLNKWIDLIWGEKQRGEKAEEANNTYLPQMYDSIWNEKTMSDPAVRAQTEAIMCHVGQVPVQLFDQAHPCRIPVMRREPLISTALSVSLGTQKIIASSIDVSQNKMRFSTIDAHGQCTVSVFDTSLVAKMQKKRKPVMRMKSSNSDGILSATRSISQGRYSNGDVASRAIVEVEANSDVIVSNKILRGFDQIRPSSSKTKAVSSFVSDGSCLIVGANKTDLFRVKVNAAVAEMVQRQRDEITNISSNEEWVATANNDAELVLFRCADYHTPVFRIPSFTSSIACSVVNAAFHAVVVGTRDGSLLFCSLNSGSVVKIVSLGDARPSAVLITPEWGFVAVYMTKIEDGALKHILALYTINGDFIRSTNLENAIVSWSCFKSTDGFDHIVMADSQGDCYLFEAFYLTPGAPFYNSEHRVTSISFLFDASIALLVTESGKIQFVPAPLSQ